MLVSKHHLPHRSITNVHMCSSPVYTHMRTHTRTRVHMHAHTYMHIRAHTRTHTHTHTHAHAHTHTHTHTHTHMLTRVNIKQQSKRLQCGDYFIGLDIQPADGKHKGGQSQDELEDGVRRLLVRNQEQKQQGCYST